MLSIFSFVSALVINVSATPAYYQYNYSSFYKLQEVNEKVNWEALNTNLLEAAIYQCTNEQRTLNKRTEFKYAIDLNKASNYHSHSMVKYNFFSHTNPFEKNMKAFYQRMKFFGGNFRSCGENIAYADFDESYTYLEVAQNLVQLWMDSEPHRINILNSGYFELGCGIAVKEVPSYHRVYATQDFGGERNNNSLAGK